MKNTAQHIIHLIDEAADMSAGINMMSLILRNDKSDGPIANWPELARLMLTRLRTERLATPDKERLNQTISHLQTHPALSDAPVHQPPQADVVIPVKIKAEGCVLSLFSMIAQFGSVQELSMHSLRLELFFPQDDTTQQYLETL